MPGSAFADKSWVPQDPELAEVLGPVAPLWLTLKSRATALFAPLVGEWTFAGKNHGWSLRLKQKSRAVFYMTPCHGHFRAAFALGEKAAAAAHTAGLPDAVLGLIENARKYPEGRAVRIEVRSEEDVDSVLLVARIKMAN